MDRLRSKLVLFSYVPSLWLAGSGTLGCYGIWSLRVRNVYLCGPPGLILASIVGAHPSGEILSCSPPGVKVIKLFTAWSYTLFNKLERLSLASLSSLVQYLLVRPEPTWVKRLSGDPLYGRLLVSPTNIILGPKGLPGTNARAFYENS